MGVKKETGSYRINVDRTGNITYLEFCGIIIIFLKSVTLCCMSHVFLVWVTFPVMF